MRDLDEVFERLKESPFRRRFRLRRREMEYLRRKGLPQVVAHAAQFIDERLAPAEPPNDGKQTPFANHPAFVAQHATATCCRGCLAKWHGIPKGRELSAEEKAHVVAAIERWLAGELAQRREDAKDNDAQDELPGLEG
jgi:hypothetical protein